jgi:hypothetical protein
MHRALEIRRKLLRRCVILVGAYLHRAGELGRVHGFAQRSGVSVALDVGGRGERRALTRRRQLGESIDRRRFCACRFGHLGPQHVRIDEIRRGGQHPLRCQRPLRRKNVHESVRERAYRVVADGRHCCRDRRDDIDSHTVRLLRDP